MKRVRKSWRKFRRVIPGADQPLGVEIQAPAGLDSAGVCDISEGGMELALPALVPAGLLGETLRLRLTLPGVGALSVAGQVRHVGAERLGILFEELSESDRQRLRRYIREVRTQSVWQRLSRLLGA